MAKAKWTQAGHRSVKHNGVPRMVVRFTGEHVKPKLLESEIEFNAREQAAGRNPGTTMAALIAEASECWKEIQAAQLKGLSNAGRTDGDGTGAG